MNKKIIFGIFSVLMGAFFLIIICFVKANKLINNSYKSLEEVSVLKTNKIDSYLSIVEDEINKLAISDETKLLLKQKTIEDKDFVKNKIDQKAKIIAKKIENYISNNPQKTFDELKNDPVFKQMTNQTIGINGFSIVEDFDKQVSSFNENGSFLEEKYTYSIKIKVKTADGINLVTTTTAYVNDFKINKESINTENNLFKENIDKKDFNNLYLIDNDGYIVYAKDFDEGAGENINWEDNKDSILTKKITEIKNGNKSIFSDAYIDNYGEAYPEFLALSPVYDQNELLGYIALAKDLNTIFGIVRDNKNLGKTGESYLVSKNQNLLISPLRQKNFDMFIQIINTDNINNCFSGIINSPEFTYDYNHIKVLGFNSLISKMPWCLSTEINENEILDVSFNKEWLISILFFLFIFFVCNLVFSKKNTIFIKKHDLVDLFIKIKLEYVVLFSIFLVVIYFFLVTLFFQGWEKAAFYNDTPDILCLLVLNILFLYGFKLRNYLARQLISIGSFLVILDKAIQIILQEYNNTFGLVPLSFWIPGTTIGFIGLFLLFYGFKKEMSK